MAAVKISGVLKDGAGKPIQNCTIQLKAKRNSTTVLVNTVASENPDEAGRYSMDVEYGQYSVTLLVEGFPPSHAGIITVYEGSRPGTLNDFLGAMTEDDVMPEALRRFEAMVEEAARNAEAASQSAAAAKKSETAAASSKNAAKTSETNAANSAQAAAASQTASANSATAAKKSETNAKNSETAAKTSETNAKSSQTAAKTSETNAKASETAAKNSQNAAAESESAAAGSATSAAGSATAAANSQKAAKTSETNAKSSQTAAKTSETNAKASETAAKSSQDAAAESESAAAGSASAAAASATASANSQKAAKTSETNAKTSETAAANSAQASAASQTAAKASEDAAREYASQAAEPYKQVLQPLPDVWIPFNDSLDMITGFSPSYKKIVIGDDEITMPGDKVVKFKRASKATYINKSGVLTEAAIDEPRFERDGLLIEGQRTNYMLNSESPASWGRSSNMDVPETGTDSFGFTYGKFVCNDSLIGQTSAINIASIAATKSVDVSGDNKYVTTSCRFKTELQVRLRIRFDKYDGSATTFLGDAYIDTQTLEINMTGGASGRITARVRKEETTGWIFAEATIQAIDGELKIGSQIQYSPKQGGATVSGDYIYLATPQVENGACVSSFIISGTTAATRASDMVTIPTENNIYNRPLTCLVEVNRNWGDIPPNVAPRIFDFSGVPPIESITYAFNTTEKYYGQLYMQTYKASTSSYVSSLFTGRTDVRKFIGGFNIYSDGTKRVVSNGEATKTMKTEWTGVKTRTFIRIGGQATSGTRHLFGHLRNLRLWHKELTDAQMGESIK
ncbi:prophage tail fiber N-terminal domain-containing protein [Escherichia coli]|uniref:Prophage tail fiber N-terminal domain-containing protein n=14 Tax=Bacteria TaxID=2 RepID=A0A7L5X6V7_9ESCH|nr:prophage tail fiber N-terminal domain-containing protein [Escherichia marmotae]MCK2400252.1 prophage tail fiber N-terminal domain-containing protein [Escherichia coli]MCK2463845.1 prophage tail fiber N-terminal domain-containing protein [Escherichia coli]MCK2487103.1 prophage tail fiber N-terminal domain-containing protein [Escherichia coli]MCK2644347.1 prophage tail fiber N-terminal domain-containing protein [Escherichia coli]QLP27424.1 prophage tail fiber N-terminal domain-containing prot